MCPTSWVESGESNLIGFPANTWPRIRRRRSSRPRIASPICRERVEVVVSVGEGASPVVERHDRAGVPVGRKPRATACTMSAGQGATRDGIAQQYRTDKRSVTGCYGSVPPLSSPIWRRLPTAAARASRRSAASRRVGAETRRILPFWSTLVARHRPGGRAAIGVVGWRLENRPIQSRWGSWKRRRTSRRQDWCVYSVGDLPRCAPCASTEGPVSPKGPAGPTRSVVIIRRIPLLPRE